MKPGCFRHFFSFYALALFLHLTITLFYVLLYLPCHPIRGCRSQTFGFSLLEIHEEPTTMQASSVPSLQPQSTQCIYIYTRNIYREMSLDIYKKIFLLKFSILRRRFNIFSTIRKINEISYTYFNKLSP